MRKPGKIKQLRHFAMGFQGDNGYGRAVTIDFLDDPWGELPLEAPDIGEELSIGPLLEAAIGHVRTMRSDKPGRLSVNPEKTTPAREPYPDDKISVRKAQIKA
jgi:hypothetical protein